MDRDRKIIPITGETSPSEAPQLSDDLYHLMEERLGAALSDLDQDQKSQREELRHEIQSMVKDFEDRMNERFHRMFEERQTSKRIPFQDVASATRKLGDVLKRMISVPDIEFMRRSDQVDEFGLDHGFESQIMPLFQFLHEQYWRVDTLGLEHIPNDGAAMIVANHSGTLPADGAMIKVAVRTNHPARRSVRFLVEDFVYYFPFLGMGMSRFGGVRACQENAERLLKKGHLVVVFPEGIKGIGKLYRDRYQVQRFGRGGVIRLALKTGTPIIPTAVIGAEEIYPMLSRSTLLARPLGVPYVPITPLFPLLGPLGLLPLPSKWAIVFGPPIRFEDYGPKDADDRLLVSRLNEQLRQRIQEMIKDQLAKRVSVWV